MEFRLTIFNPLLGIIVVVLIVAIILFFVGGDILKVAKHRRDMGAAYEGRVVKRGIDDDGEGPQWYYLILESEEGNQRIFYCRFEGYARCHAGDYVRKEAGRDKVPLPLGQKSTYEQLEDAEKAYAERGVETNLSGLKKSYEYR